MANHILSAFEEEHKFLCSIVQVVFPLVFSTNFEIFCFWLFVFCAASVNRSGQFDCFEILLLMMCIF